MCTIVLALALVAFVYHFLFPKPQEIDVRVVGALIDPLTMTPVAGVDLVVGDTTIRSGETGQYVFSAVSTMQGIRLTHPELLRAIVKLPESTDEEQKLDILFSVDLYNALIFVVDREGRGKVDAIYERFASSVKRVYSQEEFHNLYEQERLYTENDVTAQEIVVRSIHHNPTYYSELLDLRFKDVITFELVNGEYEKLYRFAPDENGAWDFIL